MKSLATRQLLLAMSLLVSLLTVASCARAQNQYEAGKHYEVLPQPVTTRDPAKIEVVEVFWYGCIHCFHFEPLIEAWTPKLGADVDFHGSPAMWNASMKIHAQAYFTAEALGVLDKVHVPLFKAMNDEKKRLATADEIAPIFTAAGVSKADFDDAFESFGVNNQVALADSRARSYRVQGTPELVVNGKYRVSASMAGGQAEMLKVADFLIGQERAAKKK
jgi:protein dithiol oxidoreductase (disulfide-forming)